MKALDTGNAWRSVVPQRCFSAVSMFFWYKTKKEHDFSEKLTKQMLENTTIILFLDVCFLFNHLIHVFWPLLFWLIADVTPFDNDEWQRLMIILFEIIHDENWSSFQHWYLFISSNENNRCFILGLNMITTIQLSRCPSSIVLFPAESFCCLEMETVVIVDTVNT